MVKMQEFEITADDLSVFIKFSDKKYCRNLIFENEHTQLICVCWKPGQNSPIHDHASSACAVKIISGIATETIYQKQDNGTVRELATLDHPSGAIGSNGKDIHCIANLPEHACNLITLHCYTPPLKDMQHFRCDEKLKN